MSTQQSVQDAQARDLEEIPVLRANYDAVGMKKVLGANKYPEPSDVLWEIIKNHLAGYPEDAESKKVFINKHTGHPLKNKAGEKVLEGNPSWSVTDFGSGFNNSVLSNYGNIGKSAEVLYGVHGVGKVAAFALMEDGGDAGSAFYIITRPEANGPVYVYEIGDSFFAGEPVDSWVVENVSDLPNMPENGGTFSQLVIPNVTQWDNLSDIAKKIRHQIPLTGQEIFIEGKLLEVPNFTVLYTTRTRAVDKVGSVYAEIGVWGGHVQENPFQGLLFVDSTIGLPCWPLSAHPGVINKPEFRILSNVALCARIFVPDVRQQAMSTNKGFRQGFLNSKAGEGIKKYIKEEIVPLANLVIDQEGYAETNAFDDDFAKIIEMCKGKWAQKPRKKVTGRPPKPPGEPEGKRLSRPRVQIENHSYILTTQSLSDLRPAWVDRGQIMVNSRSPMIAQLLKINQTKVRSAVLLQCLLQAHVAKQYRLQGDNLFDKVARLAETITPKEDG